MTAFVIFSFAFLLISVRLSPGCLILDVEACCKAKWIVISVTCDSSLKYYNKTLIISTNQRAFPVGHVVYLILFYLSFVFSLFLFINFFFLSFFSFFSVTVYKYSLDSEELILPRYLKNKKKTTLF